MGRVTGRVTGLITGLVRDRPPAEVLTRAGLGKGERVRAYARSEGTWVLGTPLALLVVPPEGAARRIEWQGVEKAGWDQEESVLEVAEVGRWGEQRPVHRFSMPQSTQGIEGAQGTRGTPTRLLQLVRERVTASIVLQRRVPVFGRRGATVNARRPPTGGEITWLVEYDAGVHPDDPDVSRRVAVALAAARAEVV